MVLVTLAYHSLRNRRLTTGLTVLSIALSVALLVGVEQVRTAARESFSNTISQTDLIVGARGGSVQLLLYAVFHMGLGANDVSYASYEQFRNHPAVAWTIPYSLGDSHRGFRVVGTTSDFYSNYRFRRDRKIEFAEGRAPEDIFDVALGWDAAQSLQYRIGDRVIVSHGISEGRGIQEHGDKPFHVVGILARTNTPVDRALYVTLYGIEAIHVDWADGGPPLPGEQIPANRITKENLDIRQISAFLLRARSRIDTLRLQREINTYPGEPLMAIIPGVALAELWQAIGYVEDALTIVSVFVLAVGMMGMLVSLYTSLNERRREMAILRALGAGPRKVIFLLVLESGILSAAGTAAGIGLMYLLTFFLQPLIETRFGLSITIQPLTRVGYAYGAAVVLLGLLIGFAPAVKAYRNALFDGLCVRI